MSPVSVKQLLKHAKSALDDKDFDNAVTICREVLKADKQNYHAYVFIGVATAAQGDLARAIQSYQRAIKLRPNLPLAYKGVIDALSASTKAEHHLVLARAHFQLSRNSVQYVDKSLPMAAAMLYSLALEDATLISEAVDVLRETQRGQISSSRIQAAETVYRIARLLLRNQQSRPAHKAESLEEALETKPLSEALDEYTKLLTCGARPPLENDVAQIVVQRAVLRCLRGDRFEANLDTLRKAHAYEAILQVAELDQAIMIKAEERVLSAMRHVHLNPFATGATRSKYIFAAEIFRKSRRLELASQISRVDVALAIKQTGSQGKPLVSSCTHAVVNAYLHLARGEYKVASLVASAGRTIAAAANGRYRCEALFDLLGAAALRGDRKYKEALKLYNRGRLYGQREGHSWIENASHQGIVMTSVLAYGRRSRQACTAVEEAAGSSSSMFGVLECAWTDALVGEPDVLRMEELVEQVTERANSNHIPCDSLEWECSVLDSMFVRSVPEIAAIGKTRLGQTILQETGGSTDGLMRAKRHQMDAATLFKGSPDPFAHLGYILEELSARHDDDKMLSRAIRCYEKGVAFDPAHPLASRRLARLLVFCGHWKDASSVTRDASEKDPKARWAHNVTGWTRLLDGRPIEAAVSFRNALRGQPRLSYKEEEALFGTTVGHTEDDNPLVIDVDSWRGLSAAYTRLGKLGPAAACIEDAIGLVRDPPKSYVASTSDIPAVQKTLRLILDAEKALLLLSQRRPPVVACAMDSLRTSVVSLPLMQHSLSDAFVELAAEQWMQGSYSRATHLRQKAAQLMEKSIEGLAERYPQQNATCLLKRLGDILMEIVTYDPSAMSNIVGKALIHDAIAKAITAYARALHLSPWLRNERVQDIIAAMSRMAHSGQDEKVAKGAVHIAASTKLEPALTSIALLDSEALTSQDKLRNPVNRIAISTSVSSHSKKSIVELSTAISCYGCQDGVDRVVDSAVEVIRQNPVDWRGWYAVGMVREADAKEREWPQEVAKSCEEAFCEADRLGGGPAAVAGRVRCSLYLIRRLSNGTAEDTSRAYFQACLCASNAARIKIDEPAACKDVIDKHRQEKESTGRAMFQDVSTAGGLELQRNFHLFPFLDEALGALQLLIDKTT